MEKQTLLLSWTAYEYTYAPKPSEWYWALGILTFAFLVIAYLLNNFLFGVLVIISGFTLALYAARLPKKIKFAISPRGILIENRLYPYQSLRSFWIEYSPPHKQELIILSKKVVVPKLIMPFEDTDPVKMREILINFLPENYIENSLADALAKLIKF
ncbi:MAG: hypothetical protein COU46_00540 [Candidatus Niyogibacteria bacterium CG10_big_fil_rev_8_21_14_0_10_42_19]|uniref:DUF5673 domain-containing protein n=1 Tax=Candidatus Niyogibacteria bacterium CG10_big_fil_rev_8_21_14_0_10_42_19 TaxID=1974725 RepID=A0A2H0TGE9_9BACT|nr:MAG: hypothetical protein COU46_00540 [Candidatus Niyogibacteria bacterium CG10_big_fil_rev_8_21_14_0_10_42_19]